MTTDRCPECSNAVSRSAAVCPHCGFPSNTCFAASIPTAPANQPAVYLAKRSRNQRPNRPAPSSSDHPPSPLRRVVLVLTAVTVVVLAFGGGAYLGDRRSGSAPSSTTNTPSQEPIVSESTPTADPTPDLYEEWTPTADDLKPDARDSEGYVQPLSTALSSDERADVRLVQRCLNRRGYGVLTVDGRYGDKTAASVRAFQSDYQLEVDGIVGPETWRQLCGWMH